METNVFYMISMIIIGCLCGVFFMCFGGWYYERRFNKRWNESVVCYAVSVVLGGFAAAAFASYEYRVTDALALTGLVTLIMVIGRIDKYERIIPNCMIIILLLIRTVLYGVEMVVMPEYGVFILKSGLLGVLFWTAMLGIFKVLCKEKIGMGDIKLLLVEGYYLGIFRCSLVLMIILIIAVICIVIKVVTRKIKMKDYVSFGPYIAIGSYVALMLGC